MIHQEEEQGKSSDLSMKAKDRGGILKKRSSLGQRKLESWGSTRVVAGRLLEELGQTVIVLNIEDGRAKGSTRSVEAVDIFEALDPHRDLCIHRHLVAMRVPQG